MPKINRHVNLRKTSLYAIVINSLQIVMTATVMAIVLLSEQFYGRELFMRLFASAAAAMVIWGAVLDIKEAMAARKSELQLHDMTDTLTNIEQLNQSMRIQRHDFLNHLQVVYSLIEMDEHQEANAYIEKVYGSISSLGRVLKTKNAAVNALLQVKLARMDELRIQYDVQITSDWANLPIPGWEMCKVLSNLLDNAIDALSETGKRRISITLSENLKQYTFEVSNNGPAIAETIRPTLFLPGITTKATGRGMGLFIVRKTLEAHSGDVWIESHENETIFKGFIPKSLPQIGVADTNADNAINVNITK